MKKYFLIFAFALFPMLAQAENLSHSYTLSNGMEVIVIPNHKVPAVTHMVWYKAGAIDEPPEKTGVAHYLEHLMFKGTKTTSAGEFSGRIAEFGGYDNALTSYDYTAYFQVISKNQLDMVMSMEADRMQNLDVEKIDAENELQVVLEERRSSIENSPSSQLIEDVSAILFPGHRYGQPVIGTKKDIVKLTLNDAMEFYKKYYAPNNAVLVVSGDVEPEKVHEMAEKYYGDIPKREIPERDTNGISPIMKHRITKSDERVTEPEWVRFYRCPSIKTSSEEKVLPVIVLTHILGGTDTSRLYESMVIDKKIAASLSSYFDETALGETSLSISIYPSEGVDLKQIEQVMEKEIQNIIENGINEDELERVKEYIKSKALFARDSVKGMGFIIGRAAAIGIPTSYVENWAENIDKVTAEDVQNAAREILNKKDSVTGVLLP